MNFESVLSELVSVNLNKEQIQGNMGCCFWLGLHYASFTEIWDNMMSLCAPTRCLHYVGFPVAGMNGVKIVGADLYDPA